MQTQTISRLNKEKTKKKIFSIIEKLEPLELNSLEYFAEYLAQRNSEAKFLELLRNAKPEDEELDQNEIESIKLSKEQIMRGEFRDFEEYSVGIVSIPYLQYSIVPRTE